MATISKIEQGGIIRDIEDSTAREILNKFDETTLEKLSTSEDGKLLFNGEEIKGNNNKDDSDEDVIPGGESSGDFKVYTTEERRVGTWIDGKPIYRVVGGIPIIDKEEKNTETLKMTSNSAPSPFVAKSSTQLSDAYGAFRAFGGATKDSSSDCWATTSGSSTNQWISLYFGEKVLVKTAKIKPRLNTTGTGYAEKSPKNFSFQGSNDGTNWTTIKSFTNITGWTANTYKTFDLDNLNEYSYYRLYVNSVNGGTVVTIGSIVYYYEVGKLDIDTLIYSDTTNKIYEYTKLSDDPDSFNVDMLSTGTLSAVATDEEVAQVLG